MLCCAAPSRTCGGDGARISIVIVVIICKLFRQAAAADRSDAEQRAEARLSQPAAELQQLRLQAVADRSEKEHAEEQVAAAAEHAPAAPRAAP
ncbi:hypothetical protein HXX76_012044 [Chlamydomonas incerta]|uniref:Uncharacterized protein n=1 Tax=Chlamydomonas incerta TaxID=51695 RepID=A0A835SY66_CHLIN|nr:hypothetical protein HXX76_012044 [Chlamydomonas incerta]|eukprot:KAG2428061.1 hypothetical protein HXX76_012044 [Chlamydomonas incerta]